MRYIAVQACGIILLLTMMILGGRKKNAVSTRNSRIFRRTMYIVLACLILDIISVIAIIKISGEYITVISLICRIYLVSIVCVGLSIFEYLLADQPKRDLTTSVFKAAGRIVAVASTYPILFNEMAIYYNDSAGSLYTDGGAVMGASTGMLVLMGLTIVTSVCLNGRLPKGKVYNIRAWAGLIIICGFIQFVNKDFLIVGFAMALGASVAFEKTESPNRWTDIESGLFNSAAFKAYIAEEYAINRQVYCIRLAVNTSHKDLSVNEAADIVKMISGMLQKCPGMAFRTSSYSFAIVSENPISISLATDKICDFIREADVNLILPGIRNILYTIKNPALFSSAADMINLYYKLKSYKPDKDDPICVVDVNGDVVSRISQDEQTRKDISSALEENRVEVFYQPIYDTRTGLFSSAEALVRLRKKDGGIIPPGEIIPVAEDSGLIIPLGERVFSLVCDLLGSDRKPAGLKYVEVNLSAVQCRHEALYGTFKAIMDRAGVGPGQINLEITETARLSTTQKTISVFNSFRKDGVSFSLDDFGTGNSNLDYVTSMPMISIVKFDHMMTSGFFTNDRIKAVFPHIISMVKEMGLEIVCEGVETKEHLDVMREYGIEYIQGYYFSKPLPEDEFIRFMAEHSQKSAEA